MKIAPLPTMEKIIKPFERTPYCMVITLEGGVIVDRELREKLGHAHFYNQPHEVEDPGHPHGIGAAAPNRNLQIAEAIADCKALLCGGKGIGAYQGMLARGIKPVVTDILDNDQAVLVTPRGRFWIEWISSTRCGRVDQTNFIHTNISGGISYG